MAFGRLERSPRTAPMSEINMTPLIDVMLVLLVIFMITAPLMTSSLKLELPRSDAARPGETPLFISISIDATGQLYVDTEPVDATQLNARLLDAARRNPQTELQLRADRAVPYGRVAELIGSAHKAGLVRIGFVTEPAAAKP